MSGAPRRLRIGLMGGTFDPIHHGHLVAASEVQHVFGLDEVIFVPTLTQPFKKNRRVAPAEHRYLMTVIATASNPRFTVSRADIDRGGTTYTIDTLHDVIAEYPGAELYFITGADALTQILTWKDNAACRRTECRWSRCPLWPSRPRTAAVGSPRAAPSGTSCPTASSSTSGSTGSTVRWSTQHRRRR